ncbi:DUF3667 domain-containing protein [Pseudoduganella chitinolytica]|uniref:DUF3667 domain-containing protein n=1 Tax=Pseudoduganella chitinolytica TaxID=34070 RepID=A0ABY8BAZ0_9BURK|nr:DUF3667 domain-containing protein [Pseudoduganella chitinolytica]WEF31534.1 DUF3667 domain-containing protein [Pseudoduganella chitinolytica]
MQRFTFTADSSLKPATIEAAGHHDVPSNCRNCGAAVSGHYCAQCGQETRLHMPSLGEFVHEFVGHYVAVEGRLWGSLGRLLFRPGALTNEYLAGRRRRYVEPLRLYLSLSILFFALMKFTATDVVHFNTKKEADGKAVAAQQGKPDAMIIGDADDLPEDMPHHTTLPAPLEELAPGLRQSIDHFDRLSKEQKSEVIRASFFRYAPYAMFCLMPLFALYLKLLYLGTGRRYGEHVLFALHTNAFAFVLFGAFLLMPEGFLKFALFCWLLAYLPWAMKRVYGKSRWGTAWRWFLLVGLHTLSLAIAIVIALGLGIATTH